MKFNNFRPDISLTAACTSDTAVENCDAILVHQDIQPCRVHSIEKVTSVVRFALRVQPAMSASPHNSRSGECKRTRISVLMTTCENRAGELPDLFPLSLLSSATSWRPHAKDLKERRWRAKVSVRLTAPRTSRAPEQNPVSEMCGCIEKLCQ